MNATDPAVHAIGIDVGGTKIAGGVVESRSGKIVLAQTIPTLAHRGGTAVLEDCLGLIARLQRDAAARGVAVSGVGLGLCELVDPAGRVTSAYNFDWRTLPVQERCTELAPTLLTADVRAAARAEARYGAGQAHNSFAYVTVGTGISSTVVQAGEPWTGERGNALVLASMPLTTICPHCGALLRPTLEEFASGPALVRRYNAEAASPVTTGQDVLAALAAGDKVARAVVSSAGDALGTSVAFLCNIVDPAAVVVGGGLGLAGGLYWERFVSTTRSHIYATSTRQLPIVPAALGVGAGVIGAAATFLQRAR